VIKKQKDIEIGPKTNTFNINNKKGKE